MDERAAVARLKNGDIGGLEVLVRAYQVRAVRVADLIVRDRSLAEDIVQDTFLRVYERIDQFDADRPFGPWLMGCVVHEARQAAIRRERCVPFAGARETHPEELLVDQMPDPEAMAESTDLRSAVWTALGRLPPAQRATLVQRYYLGLSEQEMAVEAGCAPGTIKWRLHVARERLRRWMHHSWRPSVR